MIVSTEAEHTDDDQAIAPTHSTPISITPPKTQNRNNLRNSSANTRNIPRRILGPIDRPPTNPTHASKPHKQRTRQRTLPLSANIIRLIRQGNGDIGVATGGDEEDAEVADAAGVGEGHDGEADETDEGVGDEDGAADVVSVAEVGGGDHEDGGDGILWVM